MFEFELTNLLIDFVKNSENALADAKLRVSQTRNEQMVREREVIAREGELVAEMQKFKKEREQYVY